MIESLRARARLSLSQYTATVDEILERQSKSPSDPPMARDSRDSEPDSDDVVMSVDAHAAH
jgi:hypothetical protein